MTAGTEDEGPGYEVPGWLEEADRLRGLTDDELGDSSFWAECSDSYWRTDHLDPDPGSRWAEGLRRVSERAHAERIGTATGATP